MTRKINMMKQYETVLAVDATSKQKTAHLPVTMLELVFR